MAEFDTVLIRYGELSTKGKNRKDFTKKLLQNIKRMLKQFPDLQYTRTYDRIYIHLNGSEDIAELRRLLSMVFGISSFSFTEKVKADLEVIEATALRMAQETKLSTFKIVTKRHDKTFPMNSDGINRAVAGVILKNTDHKVDVHNPDFKIRIEVHEDAAYLTSEKIPGAGGYPTGINGKVLLMLSGGIDSPVAAYELMKRGIEVEAVHFASPPYTSDNARKKVMDLASLISIYQGRMKVHVINFTDMQLAINKAAGDPYSITLMRRMMFRIAEKVAENNHCLALATGESIGQVASQTLESVACINSVIHMPVIRPLVCFDKIEIIELARKINTYEISIEPFEDCCTIFDPKNPVTKPVNEKAEAYESRFDYAKMIEDCMNSRFTEVIHPAVQEEYL